MDKKLIILLLAFTLGLAACGSENVPTEALPIPETTNTTAPDPTDLPDPTEIPEETPVLAVKETTEEQSEKPSDDISVEIVPKVLLDDLGREVTLNGPAQRIVTLGPSSLESLFSIGAGSQVVGREEFSTYPDEALEALPPSSVAPTRPLWAWRPRRRYFFSQPAGRAFAAVKHRGILRPR